MGMLYSTVALEFGSRRLSRLNRGVKRQRWMVPGFQRCLTARLKSPIMGTRLENRRVVRYREL